MDTEDTAETTAASVARCMLAQKPKSLVEPEPENPVPSVPLSGLQDDSLGNLGAAFSELHVQTPEGKTNKKDTGEGGAKGGGEGKHERIDDVSSAQRLSESAAGATKHPTESSPRPLHSQPHTQQHLLIQPSHPWLSEQALLACLTQPMEWNHSLLSHLLHLPSENQ